MSASWPPPGLTRMMTAPQRCFSPSSPSSSTRISSVRQISSAAELRRVLIATYADSTSSFSSATLRLTVRRRRGSLTAPWPPRRAAACTIRALLRATAFRCALIPVTGSKLWKSRTSGMIWRISSNRNAIDGSSNGPASPFGYFCDDLLGAWIVTYFWWTQNAVGGISSTGQTITPTATCNTVLAQAAKANGTSLDGTPILHTGTELHFIEGVPGTPPQFGFTQNQTNAILAAEATAPCGLEGNL